MPKFMHLTIVLRSGPLLHVLGEVREIANATPRAASFGQLMPDWISSFGIAVPHLPNGPCSYIVYIYLGPTDTYMGTTLGTKYIGYTYKEPLVLVLKRQRGNVKGHGITVECQV